MIFDGIDNLSYPHCILLINYSQKILLNDYQTDEQADQAQSG